MQVRGDGAYVPAATADPAATRLHIKAANKKRIVTCMLLNACSKHCNVIYGMQEAMKGADADEPPLYICLG